MKDFKESIHNTHLPFILMPEKDHILKYQQIGHGDEAMVYQYNEYLAFKVFSLTKEESSLSKKFEKIELLGKLTDENATFPIGLIGYEEELKEGYYCPYVNANPNYRDFNKLEFLKDMQKVLKFVVKADAIIAKFHKMGIILGDIKEDNIMIDINDKVIFVDTDNWMYGGYDFDLKPARSLWLTKTYEKESSLLDNDRFVFTIMALQFFIESTIIGMHLSDNYFKKLIEYMNVSPEVKDGLRLILSDAINKPYLGPILQDINLEEPLITKKQAYALNLVY